MFTKILVANRGEIACRVMKTARRLGIATVAVHSEADRHALHVSMADEAVHIGAAPSRDSYLAMDKIIAAALQTGAEAVHPGYGFLSENEAFARRVVAAGLVFIGPPADAIAAMGDKIASKALAERAGVNTIAGHNAAIDSADEAVTIARRIGHPVMIKASAGGGGKGLRLARTDEEVAEGFTACRNEARQSFGDDRVFIEQFIERPRHIEIQVLGDSHGHLVHLHERECSIQRRHQKVIEEAPSPFLSEATRQAMGAQAVALARAVNYQSAGTVEFVVGQDQSFHFLEMNTRLQVEHPVTECITGLDLVEWMIRIAAGQALPFAQHEIRREGWALECRINAEDPARQFLPSTGRLLKYRPPAEADGVRLDTGVQEGGEVSVHYDSLLAKLVVHGRDRAEAIAKMRQALNAFVVRGVQSTVAFQAAVVSHPDFMAGTFDTGFIAEHFPQGFDGGEALEAPVFLAVLAAAAHRLQLQQAARIGGQLPGREHTPGTDFVVQPAAGEGAALEVQVHADVDGEGSACTVTAGPHAHRIEFHTPLRDIAVHGSVDGQVFCAQIERLGLAYRVLHDGRLALLRVLSPREAQLRRHMPRKAPPDGSKLLRSPMPGLLVNVAVKPGQAVRSGEKLAVVEAMKMENILLASQDGRVAEVQAAVGDSLAVDQIILRFE